MSFAYTNIQESIMTRYFSLHVYRAMIKEISQFPDCPYMALEALELGGVKSDPFTGAGLINDAALKTSRALLQDCPEVYTDQTKKYWFDIEDSFWPALTPADQK